MKKTELIELASVQFNLLVRCLDAIRCSQNGGQWHFNNLIADIEASLKAAKNL